MTLASNGAGALSIPDDVRELSETLREIATSYREVLEFDEMEALCVASSFLASGSGLPLPAASGSASGWMPKVKALEWLQPTNGPDDYRTVAQVGDFAERYEIEPSFGSRPDKKFQVKRSSEIQPFAWAGTINEAKAAAQADFERRVLAALEIPPSVDGLDAGENGLPRGVAGAAEATIKALRAALQPFSQAILPDQTTLSGWRFGYEPSHDDFLHARAVYYGTDSVALQTAAERDVLAERRRQVEAEGWTPEHDDQHEGGEIALAAACYLTGRADLWPWSGSPKFKDLRTDLVRGVALGQAEIERLDRAALEGKGLSTDPKAPFGVAGCDMGTGCQDAGRCYATANGQPDRCPKAHPTELHRLLDAVCGILFGAETEAQYRALEIAAMPFIDMHKGEPLHFSPEAGDRIAAAQPDDLTAAYMAGVERGKDLAARSSSTEAVEQEVERPRAKSITCEVCDGLGLIDGGDGWDAPCFGCGGFGRVPAPFLPGKEEGR